MLEKITDPYEQLLVINSFKRRLEKLEKITDPYEQLLVVAALKGNLEEVKRLVEEGTDVRTGQAALRYAAENGHLETVKWLVEAGADIHTWDDYPLRCSAVRRHLNVVKYLISKGADIDNSRAFEYAFWKGKVAVLKYLAEKGAKIDPKSLAANATLEKLLLKLPTKKLMTFLTSDNPEIRELAKRVLERRNEGV